MVYTENQLINASVLKLKKFLQKIHKKEVITEEQVIEVKQLVSSLVVDSDPKIHITNKSPSFYSIYESILNLHEPSVNEITPLKSSQKEPEPIYATINKSSNNSPNRRVKLRFETFQPNICNNIKKGQVPPQISVMVTPETYKATIYSTPKLEKVQLTDKNIESFKNYINNNLFNSTFKSINNDDSLIIKNRDALELNNVRDDLTQEERFVVNIYESRPSKRWQKKRDPIIPKNIIGKHDHNFVSNTGTSVSDNQSANIDVGMCDNNNDGLGEYLENYYSTLSARYAVGNVSGVNFENDIYQSLEVFKSTCDQQQKNGDNKLIATSGLNSSPDSFYYTMADDPPYYSAVNQELETKSSLGNNEDEFFRLKQEADIQCSTMNQAYSAIEACRTTKRFYNSTEKVVAEKILLLATIKYTNLIQTIRSCQYDNILLTPAKNPCNLQSNNQPHIGKTTISHISLPLNHTWLSSNHNSTKYHNWFLVVATEGDRILSSETVLLKPGEKHIDVIKVFEFERLDAEFRVEVNVFHMRLRIDDGSRVELGFNKRVSTLCRSFRKLHYKDLQTQTLVSNCIPTSGFTKCGSIMITAHDLLSSRVNWKLTLHKPSNHNTNSIPSETRNSNITHRRQGSILNKAQEYVIPIEDTFSMDVSVQKVDLQINRSGFLTVGIESVKGTTFWNRRYCVLNDTNLYLYNDPLEADFDKECGVTISLRDSLTTSIDVASVCVCPKPKSLLLDTVRTKDNFRLRHFFKADSTQEMEIWRRDINTILSLLKNWNELPYAQSMVTDL